mgnify:CR=1 FL=1
MRMTKEMEEVMNWLIEVEGWTKKEAIQYIKAKKLQDGITNGKKRKFYIYLTKKFLSRKKNYEDFE